MDEQHEEWNIKLGVVYSDDETFARAHNDRTAALFRDDLNQHIGSVRDTLAAAEGDEIVALPVIAGTLIDARYEMPRERLASMLAVAMIRLAKLSDSDG